MFFKDNSINTQLIQRIQSYPESWTNWLQNMY